MNKRITIGSVPDRPCEICGKLYTPKSTNQRYCGSDPCRLQGERMQNAKRYRRVEKPAPRACDICGETYQPRTANQRRCGKDACHRAAGAQKTATWQSKQPVEPISPREIKPRTTGMGPAVSDFGTRLICSICALPYHRCICTCPTCGAPRHSRDPRWKGEWTHHIWAACALKGIEHATR